MSNYEDVYAPDLTEETESTLSGSEQFVMFDSVEGKRAELSTIADYIVENGEIDGSDIPTIVSTIEGSIGTVDTKVGNLTDLDTTNKTNIVSAVNEVNGKADTVDEHVGDLSELETEDKTSAVDAINEVLSKIPVMTKEVTGNPIVVDDALNADVVSLGVELEPVQGGSGTPSPTNVRPITGHDSVTVMDTGKNLLNTSEATHNAYNIGSIPNTLFPNTAYTFSVNGSAFRYRLYLAKSATPLNAEVALNSAYISAGGTTTFTTPADMTEYPLICIAGASNGAGNEDISIIKPQLEVGSTASAYESYHGHTTTVTLPHTVYGGDVDVTGGAGTEKMANIASYNGETINEPWLSSMDEYSPGATPTTGAQVVYTLATPTDLTTTPTDITLYSGDNVVSSDGDMDMVYVRDIVKVIEKLEG